MDIRCPSCSKLFRVADEKISGKGIRFKCSKCAEIITITKDDFEMDLLAREDDAAEPVPQQPPGPEARPSPPTAPGPSIKPVPPQAMPSPEPGAREYQPPQEQDLPPPTLSDFDFSEPHAAATAAAHPDEGFGGKDFNFTVEPEQEAAPEFEISPEAAAEAEAALQFPDDLISEPARKPVFGAPSASGPSADEGPGQEPEHRPKAGPEFTPSSSKLSHELQAEEELDLGTAPAMPKGPVISPDLLAQMKRNAPGKSAAHAGAAPPADEDIDLGAALAIPKTPETAGKKETEAESKTAAASRGSEASFMGKRALVLGMIALALVIVLAALYYLGFLWGKSEQEALQKPQPKSQPAWQVITPEGLSIVDPAAFFDPATGDLVITGAIQNTTDKPKAGWYLVTEVRDAKETVLSTVRTVNGIQIYSKADHDILAGRGGKIEELQKIIASLGEVMIAPKGSVPFEVRVMNPPAGSAGFLPSLRAFDLATLGEVAQEGMERK